jgi:hypothetical protein
MVGATPAAAAAIVNGCCTLMATNPTRVTSYLCVNGQCSIHGDMSFLFCELLTINANLLQTQLCSTEKPKPL